MLVGMECETLLVVRRWQLSCEIEIPVQVGIWDGSVTWYMEDVVYVMKVNAVKRKCGIGEVCGVFRG